MKLSVVIPCLNEEAFIGQCIRSVQNDLGTNSEVEIVVVDAGSSDQTTVIAESCGVQVVNHPRSTIAAQRNAGVRLSSGEVIAFLDADCTVAEGWVQNGLELFRSPEVLGGGCPPSVPSQDTTWVQRGWSFLKRKRRPDRMSVRWIPSANVWVRRWVFEQIGGFKEHLETCEDADLGFRISDLGPMISDPSLRVYHHREPRTLSEFFCKELWHGKNSFSGISSGRWTWSELPSLIAPIYFLLGLGWMIITSVLLVGKHATLSDLVLAVVFSLALPFAYTLRAVATKGNARNFIQYILIYTVYFSARSVSMISSVIACVRS